MSDQDILGWALALSGGGLAAIGVWAMLRGNEDD